MDESKTEHKLQNIIVFWTEMILLMFPFSDSTILS